MSYALCIGEMMVELSQESEGRFRCGYGGDTFNTAVYLSRLGQPTSYLSAFGDDPWSTEARCALRDEKVDDSACPTAAAQTIGLYAIRTTSDGERSFTYWRDSSPARNLFGYLFSEQVLQTILQAKLIYLSGISLWLYDAPSLDKLFSVLAQARASGTLVAFDGNYRQRLWGDDAEKTRAVYARMFDMTDICLATHDDEALLWSDANPVASHERLSSHGIPEVIVKAGPEGAWIAPTVLVETRPNPRPRDTTAAGDSFNAAYLAARLAGRSPRIAANEGNRLAGHVINYPGAIMPQSSMILR